MTESFTSKRGVRPPMNLARQPLAYSASLFILFSCLIWAALWIVFTIVARHADGVARHHMWLQLGGAAMVLVGAVGIGFAVRQLRLRWKSKGR